MIDLIMDGFDERVDGASAAGATRLWLNDVSVVWIGEGHHDRAVAALRRLLDQLEAAS